MEALLDIQSQLSNKLNKITNRKDHIEQLEKKILATAGELKKISTSLSKKRKKVFAQLEKQVNTKLKALSMGSAEIKVSHTL